MKNLNELGVRELTISDQKELSGGIMSAGWRTVIAILEGVYYAWV